MLVKTAAQIGRCGELLVQYRLLKYGIESSCLTTDTGIDLVAFSPYTQHAVTIQVKTNLQAKRAGGRGRLALDWWLPKTSRAAVVALVDLGQDRVWLFRHAEIEKFAQQRSRALHFYFYVETEARPRGSGRLMADYEKHAIENRIHEIFKPQADLSCGSGYASNLNRSV